MFFVPLVWKKHRCICSSVVHSVLNVGPLLVFNGTCPWVFPEMVLDTRQCFGRKIFREIAITTCWSFWTHGNSIIFDGASLSSTRWKEIFKGDFGLVIQRAKPSLKQELCNWLSNSM